MTQMFDDKYYANGQIRENLITYKNGFVKKEYYFASGKCSRIEFSWNGIRHGNQIEYFPDGLIKKKQTFLNGKLIYLFKKEQITKEIYKNNFGKESYIIYDNIGNIEREYFWQNKEHLDCNIYLNNEQKNNLQTIEDCLDFISRIELDKMFSGFINKTKTTTSIFVEDNVRVKLEHKNKRIYEVSCFHKNGQLQSHNFFTKSKNKYSGNTNPNEFFTYDENGKVFSHYFLKNNKYHGKCIVKSEFHDIDMEYDSGKPITGYEITYKYSQDLKYFTKFVYKNGVIIEESHDSFKDIVKSSYFEDFVRLETYDKEYNLISCSVKTSKHHCLHIEKREDLLSNVCKCCMPKELHDVFDKNVFICRHNFEDLEKNCPYYLEHIALK